MSANGVSKSAIARIKDVSWNTVARWVENAADAGRKLSDIMTESCTIRELQAEGIRTLIACEKRPAWVSTAIEV